MILNPETSPEKSLKDNLVQFGTPGSLEELNNQISWQILQSMGKERKAVIKDLVYFLLDKLPVLHRELIVD
jgi:hypothetical protein